MKFATKNANNLLSKDATVAKSAARAVVDGGDFETFCEICSKGEVIFDFIKDKIVNNLIEATNRSNCANLLLFTPYYSADFEDFLTEGLVKFAREELTDALLEIFAEGTNEQKTYCAAYFARILDPLALDFLKTGASSEFLPLKNNCAKALAVFGDRGLYNASLEKLECEDEMSALEAVEFLVAYGDIAAFEPVYAFMKKTPYAPYVALDLLGFKNFEELLKTDRRSAALNIFNAILNGYPEMLPLHSVLYADIKGLLINLNKNTPTPREAKLTLKAKAKFDLISGNENYTFDVDKSVKSEIDEIAKFLNTLSITELADAIESEFERDDEGVIDLFEIVTELRLEQYLPTIVQKINTSDYPPLICEGVKALKEFNRLDLVNGELLAQKVSDPNALALLNSYFALEQSQ